MTIAELFDFPEPCASEPCACQPEQFSHAEALAITGLNRGLLFAWYQRGYLNRLYGPSAEHVRFKSKPGRGHRRRYNLFDLAFLLALKALVDVDLPIPIAVEHAIEIFMWMVYRIHEARDLDLDEAIKRLVEQEQFGIVAIYPGDHAPLGGWHHGGYAGMVLLPSDSVHGLHQWFEQDSLCAIRLVDKIVLATQLLRRAAEVLTKHN
jgi:hypothetical protein